MTFYWRFFDDWNLSKIIEIYDPKKVTEIDVLGGVRKRRFGGSKRPFWRVKKKGVLKKVEKKADIFFWSLWQKLRRKNIGGYKFFGCKSVTLIYRGISDPPPRNRKFGFFGGPEILCFWGSKRAVEKWHFLSKPLQLVTPPFLGGVRNVVFGGGVQKTINLTGTTGIKKNDVFLYAKFIEIYDLKKHTRNLNIQIMIDFYTFVFVRQHLKTDDSETRN